MSIPNLTPAVRSVNGKYGDVLLTASDIPGFTVGNVNSVNGLVGDITLTTSNIAEGSNQYYTNARVQAFADTRYAQLNFANIFTQNQRLGPKAIATPGFPKDSFSLILSGASDTGLGSTSRSAILTTVLSGASPGLYFDVTDALGVVTTFKMQANGIFAAPNGSIPSTHTHIAAQITDLSEAIDDRISGLLVAGSGISFAYDDTANTFTITSTGGSSSNAFGTVSVSGQGDVIADAAPDILTLVAGSNITITTTPGSDSITFAVSGLTTANVAEGSNLYYTNARVLAVAAPISHTHTLAQITDAGTAASKTAGNAVGNVPLVESGGKINASILPSIAITDTFPVASQAAMLALTAETGDIAVRTDTNQTFILRGANPATLTDWELLRTPTDLVTSVNGLQGVVTLTTSNITEGSNQYYTDERVDDRIASLIVAGGGITWTYNDAAGTLTPSITIVSTQVSDFNEAVDDRAAVLIQAGGGIAWTYNDAAGTLTPSVSIVSTQVSDFNEAVDDRVGSLFTAGSNITLSYNDTLNTFTINTVPGGAAGQVQFNSGSNSFIGDNALTWDSTNDILTIGNNTASTPALILNGLASTWVYNSQGGVNRFAYGYRDTTNLFVFSRWTGSAWADAFTIDRSTGDLAAGAAFAATGKITGSNLVEPRGITVDNRPSVVVAGVLGKIIIPHNCNIIAWSILADQSGSVAFDIKAGSIGGTKTSIVASAPPALSSQTEARSTTLTGWTTAISANTVLQFEITGTPATIQAATLILELKKS
jgi:hypothetical protein